MNSSNKWQIEKVKNLSEMITVGFVGSMSHLFVSDGVPLLRGQNILPYKLDMTPSSLKFISEETHIKWAKSALQPGDVVIVRVGYPGTACVIPDKIKNLNAASLVIIRTDKSKLEPNFLCYILNSAWGKEQIASRLVGAAQQVFNTKVAAELEIPAPDIATQERIAKILGDLDRRIELNRKMNETLEQMGQALFKHYFVDNPESEGWEKKNLDEIADFKNGLAAQKYPPGINSESLRVIKIREISNGFSESSDTVGPDFPEEYIVRDGDVLFAWSGTLMTKIWTGGTGALNQHIFKVTSEEHPKWFYYRWINEHLQRFVMIAKSKAVTMGHIKRSHLSEVYVKIPPQNLFSKFDRILSSLLDRQLSLSAEILRLTEVRDALLPRLLSGDVKV